MVYASEDDLFGAVEGVGGGDWGDAVASNTSRATVGGVGDAEDPGAVGARDAVHDGLTAPRRFLGVEHVAQIEGICALGIDVANDVYVSCRIKERTRVMKIGKG